MRKALLCFFFLVLLTITCTGQTNGWTRHKDAGGNFSVLFPVEPADSVNKSDGDIESHTLLAKNGSYIYTVIYTSMKGEQAVNDETYKVFRNAVFQQLPKCEVETEAAAAPAMQSYIGHWYRLSCSMSTQVTVLGNLYWGKHYAYAVLVMYPAAVAEPGATKGFLESFDVLDSGK